MLLMKRSTVGGRSLLKLSCRVRNLAVHDPPHQCPKSARIRHRALARFDRARRNARPCRDHAEADRAGMRQEQIISGNLEQVLSKPFTTFLPCGQLHGSGMCEASVIASLVE
jgi:hypothetical protein